MFVLQLVAQLPILQSQMSNLQSQLVCFSAVLSVLLQKLLLSELNGKLKVLLFNVSAAQLFPLLTLAQPRGNRRPQSDVGGYAVRGQHKIGERTGHSPRAQPTRYKLWIVEVVDVVDMVV